MTYNIKDKEFVIFLILSISYQFEFRSSFQSISLDVYEVFCQNRKGKYHFHGVSKNKLKIKIKTQLKVQVYKIIHTTT